MKLVQSCPICKSKLETSSLQVKDYTVSSESFEISECPSCQLRITNPFPEEQAIGKYYESEEYISHSDSSKSIVDKLYHFIRKITLKQKANLIRNTTKVKNGSILDIGAGTGYFLNTMQMLNWNVMGLEPSEKARAVAKQDFDIELKDIEALYNLEKHSFDAITMWHVLEHVHDVNLYIKTIKELIKPNGKIIIAVPNYQSFDGKHYQEYWAGYDVPRHLSHFSHKSMKLLLETHGLHLANTKLMPFDSFYVSMLSEKYKTGKTRYIPAFMNGLKSYIRALSNRQSCSSIIYIAQLD